jgi:hypothetical protein
MTDRSRKASFNIGDLAPLQGKKKDESASRSDVQAALKALPEKPKKPLEPQDIPPSPPLAANNGSVKRNKGSVAQARPRNKMYRLSVDGDLIPRIQHAIKQETGKTWKQGYLYLRAVQEVPQEDIIDYLQAYRANRARIPHMPEVTVHLGPLNTVPTTPSFTPEQVEAVQRRADRLGISRSRYFSTALRIYLDRHNVQAPTEDSSFAENLHRHLTERGLKLSLEELKQGIEAANKATGTKEGKPVK